MACKNNEGVFTQGSDNFELWVVDGIFSCTVQIFYEFMLNGPPTHTHTYTFQIMYSECSSWDYAKNSNSLLGVQGGSSPPCKLLWFWLILVAAWLLVVYWVREEFVKILPQPCESGIVGKLGEWRRQTIWLQVFVEISLSELNHFHELDLNSVGNYGILSQLKLLVAGCCRNYFLPFPGMILFLIWKPTVHMQG